MARNFAMIELNPYDWGRWLIYFYDQLEEESQGSRRGFDFNSLLDSLVNELHERMRNNR